MMNYLNWRKILLVVTVLALLWFQGIAFNILQKWLMPEGGDWLNGVNGCWGRYHAVFYYPFIFLLMCSCATVDYMLLKRLSAHSFLIRQKISLLAIVFALIYTLSSFNYGGTPMSTPENVLSPLSERAGYEWKWLGVKWEWNYVDCN